MPNKIDSNLKTVTDQFTPEILGVFWITHEELSRDLLGFDEFNYLFDGLISQYLYGQEVSAAENGSDRSNVFYTNNFNQKLFLAHFKFSNNMAGILDDQIGLIQENKNGVSKKILIFDQTEKNLDIDLQKRYPQFEFINLELSKV